nr:unnamed protein product [Callosobruchus chinensis]
MHQDTFNYILDAIRETIDKTSNFRETISPEERLSVTLRYLATGSSFKTLGYSFRISDVTVGRIVHETCHAIWDQLHDVHMQFPKDEDMESITTEFWNKWKFPNCVGCIDGKHIRIQNPKHSGSMYRNYKQYFSIVLQAVAGPNYKFLAIDVGAYGKESDGGIFSHSNLCKKLENGGLVSKLGPAEIIFNERLSRARQVVECAFGIMSSKWRVLQKSIEVNPESADEVIKCICLLQNIIIDKGEVQVASTFEEISKQTHSQTGRFGTLGENRGTSSAYDVRDKFKTYFASQEMYNT